MDSATLSRAGIRHSPGYVLGVRLVGVPLYFHLHVKGEPSDFVLAIPSGELDVSDVLPLEISFPGEDSGSKRFASLADFREFWAGARMPKVAFVRRISTIAYLIVDGSIRNELELQANGRAGGAQEFHMRRRGGCADLELTPILARVGDTTFNEFFCTGLEPGRLVIPAEVRMVRVPTDLRQWLIKEFGIKGAGGGFSKMFPELDKVTSVYQTLNTDKIDQILGAELSRQGDRVQFLGMSLPEPLMASWGMIVVLVTQAYFLIHLQAFKRVASSSTLEMVRVAWIGLYDDWWAYVVTMITVCILPPFVVILAGFVTSWPFLVSGSIAVFVLKLGVESGRLLITVRHQGHSQASTESSQPEEGADDEQNRR